MTFPGNSPAVLGLHAAEIAVDDTIRAADRLGDPPARFLAMAGRLAVLLASAHHALPASKLLSDMWDKDTLH